MLKFQTNSRNGSKLFTFPTDLKEITPDYLRSVTEDVKVADNYVLVALCYREKLSTIIMTSRQKNPSINANVVPLFVKSGNTDNGFVNDINSGDILIITGSQLALGVHVVSPTNTLNVNHFVAAIEGDATAYTRATDYREYIYFLEFKLIPANEIIAVRKDVVDVEFDNPFAISEVDSGELN